MVTLKLRFPRPSFGTRLEPPLRRPWTYFDPFPCPLKVPFSDFYPFSDLTFHPLFPLYSFGRLLFSSPFTNPLFFFLTQGYPFLFVPSVWYLVICLLETTFFVQRLPFLPYFFFFQAFPCSLCKSLGRTRFHRSIFFTLPPRKNHLLCGLVLDFFPFLGPYRYGQ